MITDYTCRRTFMFLLVVAQLIGQPLVLSKRFAECHFDERKNIYFPKH